MRCCPRKPQQSFNLTAIKPFKIATIKQHQCLDLFKERGKNELSAITLVLIVSGSPVLGMNSHLLLITHQGLQICISYFECEAFESTSCAVLICYYGAHRDQSTEFPATLMLLMWLIRSFQGWF